MQLLGVVDEKAGALAVVLKEVLRGDVERLEHTLANRDARHHHDEFAPAKTQVHLEHGLDVAIGLAGTGFHLDIEIDGTYFVARQRFGQGQVLPDLYCMDFFQQLRGRESKFGVFEPSLLQRHYRLAASFHGTTRVNAVLDGAALGLAGEAIGHRLHGAGLERLLLKLQLHRVLSVIPRFLR